MTNIGLTNNRDRHNDNNRENTILVDYSDWVDMTNTHFANEERRTNKQHGGRTESAEDWCWHDNEHCTQRKRWRLCVDEHTHRCQHDKRTHTLQTRNEEPTRWMRRKRWRSMSTWQTNTHFADEERRTNTVDVLKIDVNTTNEHTLCRWGTKNQQAAWCAESAEDWWVLTQHRTLHTMHKEPTTSTVDNVQTMRTWTCAKTDWQTGKKTFGVQQWMIPKNWSFRVQNVEWEQKKKMNNNEDLLKFRVQ